MLCGSGILTTTNTMPPARISDKKSTCRLTVYSNGFPRRASKRRKTIEWKYRKSNTIIQRYSHRIQENGVMDTNYDQHYILL